MVPVLNSIGVHCAVYGNHDFGMTYFFFNFQLSHKYFRSWSRGFVSVGSTD